MLTIFHTRNEYSCVFIDEHALRQEQLQALRNYITPSNIFVSPYKILNTN